MMLYTYRPVATMLSEVPVKSYSDSKELLSEFREFDKKILAKIMEQLQDSKADISKDAAMLHLDEKLSKFLARHDIFPEFYRLAAKAQAEACAEKWQSLIKMIAEKMESLHVNNGNIFCDMDKNIALRLYVTSEAFASFIKIHGIQEYKHLACITILPKEQDEGDKIMSVLTPVLHLGEADDEF